MKPSEKTLLLLTIILNTSVFSQVQCVSCYQQNQRIGTAAANLIVNGSFEISNCPTWTSPYQNTFCTNSSYPHCTINNWLPTGGGVNTYAWLYDSTHSFIADGLRAVYFGNFFCAPCGTYGDTSCLSNNGCISTLPMGNPVSIVSGYGDTTGVSLQQTISGLIVGNTYVLEFWAGGEGDTVSNINKPSVFAVDIAFGNITLRN